MGLLSHALLPRYVARINRLQALIQRLARLGSPDAVVQAADLAGGGYLIANRGRGGWARRCLAPGNRGERANEDRPGERKRSVPVRHARHDHSAERFALDGCEPAIKGTRRKAGVARLSGGFGRLSPNPIKMAGE